MDFYEATTNVSFFLLAKTGSVTGAWKGRMTAAEQRAMFGQFLGKGTLVIDGATECLRHRVQVCFGLDWDDTKVRTFRQLGAAVTP